MGTALYRFTPWSRRGLSGALADPDTGVDLPQRATLKVGLTVSDAGSHGVDVALYGPGDVIGVDPRLIIRTDPKPHATDSEPNYLASIEFDLPELPWMLTPAAANDQDHLRPWLALIVLETTGPDAVALPKVIRERPLPFVDLTSAQVAHQLHDLANSWAWAHSQVLVEQGVATDTVAALGGNPALNLSRLVCPRRLEPMKSYMACLVPAFDLGVLRGIGGTPPDGAKLLPAWRPDQPAALTLPVYFHWEFATGPAGDFESLARELKPFKCPPTIGTTPMFVWDSLPGLMDATAPDVRDAPLLMDGALRASEGVPATLDAIDPAFQTAIAAEVNAPADLADRSAPDATRAIAAPLYGGFHANRSRIPDDQPRWLRELNLDPRGRIAAGLGAEVVRANQEVFMQACWEQVGKVLEGNALLNQGRFATEALARLHQRFASLPASRQLAVAAPLGTRVPVGALTTTATVARSSLPDATLTPAFRRFTAPRRPAIRSVARRTATSTRLEIVERLAPGQMSVDPNQFLPDGIVGLRALAAVQVGAATVDLDAIGLAATATSAEIGRLKDNIAAIGPISTTIEPRTGLSRSGLVTEAQLIAADQLVGSAASGIAVGDVLDQLVVAATAAPQADAFLLQVDDRQQVTAGAIDVDPTGRVLLRTSSAAADQVLATFATGVVGRGATSAAKLLSALPVGVLGSGTPLVIQRSDAGQVIAGDLIGSGTRRRLKQRTPTGLIKPVAELVKTPATIDRFTTTFAKMREALAIDVADTALRLVPFDLAQAASATATRLDPRRNVPARLATMVKIGGVGLANIAPGTILVPPTVDRIMVAPELPEPAYARLAAYDRTAFLPGIDEIPLNSITLLETNPRFIEAYIIGLNHEMNREMLWRSFPTDQRGTPFRQFWDWDDGGADIPPIHAFPPARVLGRSTRGGDVGGNLVLLVRGHLLRRYPNSTIAAWRAVRDGGRQKLMKDPGAGDYVPAAFFGAFTPDVSFAGFPLTREDIVEGEGWFFVIEQQVTEPRFGFDEEVAGAAPAAFSTWLDARWIDAGVAPGGQLGAGGPLAGRTAKGVIFGKDAAHMAALALQRPFRLAVHAKFLTQI